ncbi:hypothetical protein ATK30_4879 [Amycolatopsis echigonensis]|uniref:AAA domain-containing protein n=1 Tax=Amycolatopsis echigonensis TaxID=2576905 RepID=A0A2N3WJG3_9PSEU|nr:hypothetical protein [Amycolatopsis niigatensis]PKV94013.1 hypothetical protein ATK30_4879 [Amycolatopsis niigatensis]
MTAAESSSAGHAGSLVARIASAAHTAESDVVEVFATYGIPLAYPPARPRHVRVHRLRVHGVRAGTGHDGPFDRSFTFDNDFTALVASNLRGKTSVLEIITWCLRGSPRDRLQADVRRWLAGVELDATVAGQALGFRLSLDEGELTRGIVLAATDLDTLAESDAASRSGVSTLIDAGDTDDFAAQVATLMLDRLDLQPVVNAVTKGAQVGTQTHGWPAYFSAINLPAGPDKPLVGEQSMGGLAGRLLQVFLDLPAAAVLTRVKAARDVLQAEVAEERERVRQAAEQRAADRTRVQEALTDAEGELARLQQQAPGPSLTDLADAANQRAHEVADAQDDWDELNRVYREVRRQRQADEKALNNVKESEIARLLFHGLDPSACPRCETPITTERRQEELNVHRCAVCTAEVVGEPGNDEEVVAEAQARLDASRTAERTAREELEAAESALSRLTAQLETAQERLRTDSTADTVRERMNAELEVARWKGALEMLPQDDDADGGQENTVLAVLAAADKVLDQESKAAAADLLAELNAEIADLGHRFGMTALERVEIDRAARLKVIKGGGAQSFFGKQSPGEQVRLRIAVVIALLRIGARRGISTHPGLILLDSPKAEEVQDLDAAALFTELAELAASDHVQVLITTADFDVSQSALPTGCMVTAEEGAPLW